MICTFLNASISNDVGAYVKLRLSVSNIPFSILATGGAIGDVLFLFVSGYTLFLGNMDLKFDNWYKRRINRIYPTLA